MHKHADRPVLGDAGEFAAVGFSDFSSVTGAVSTFGFVFYIQPIMMPLLSEMPATERGVKILSWSTRVVVLGQLPWRVILLTWTVVFQPFDPQHASRYLLLATSC